MNRVSTLWVLLIGMTLMSAPVIAEEGEGAYEYQIQSAPTKSGTKFYFFRFDKATGAVQLLKWDDAKSNTVSWRDLREDRDAYTYEIID